MKHAIGFRIGPFTPTIHGWRSETPTNEIPFLLTTESIISLVTQNQLRF
jgi:hypothetical protein